MEEVLNQLIITFASILVLVTLVICFDLVGGLIREFEHRVFWLTLTFSTFIMVGAGGLAAIFTLIIPFWMKAGMIVMLFSASLGLYKVLRGFGKKDG